MTSRPSLLLVLLLAGAVGLMACGTSDGESDPSDDVECSDCSPGGSDSTDGPGSGEPGSDEPGSSSRPSDTGGTGSLPGPSDTGEPVPTPAPGQDSFISAGAGAGEESGGGGGDGGAAPPDAGLDGDFAEDASDGDGGDDRTVEEGDIYRVLGDSRILNLNGYRGLQVIDFSDTSAPHVIGRFPISGAPVELYAHDGRAIVLMNHWRGYRSVHASTLLESRQGGVVAIIDIAQPEKPVLLSQAFIPGNIQRSRLVRGSNGAALYVVASAWGRFTDPETDQEDWGTRTWVKSFDVSTGLIEDRTELELGGYVTDIQATPRALMVARGTDRWWHSGAGSTVTLIDISSPDGTMVPGDEVRVRGRVQSQFNMDLYNNVLRVVSGNRWGTGQGNWVQTFDARDFGNLTLIDEETFGAPNEDLFATLFLGNKAFFVTYFQVDPFHAFEITDEGIATERTEFVVSGWNDFFRAVAGETRLIGIGMNDEGGTARAAVSLYDITDLDNAEPLIERAEVSTARWTWSEANWDHRAFSVLENAVSVANEDGVEETGLVLLPFSGWDESSYRSAVQIFTFSENTLTLRGTMTHPDPVRRTFLAEPEVATNFSETEMRFHDVSDPDDPQQLGAVDLAADFANVWVFGDVSVRHRRATYHWWGPRDGDDHGRLEVFRTHEHPDNARPLGTLQISADARVQQAGERLVVLTPTGSREVGSGNRRHWVTSVRVQTVHLSNPAAPRLASGAEVDLPGYGGYGGGYYPGDMTEAGFGYWYGYGGADLHYAQGALIHVASFSEQELLGQRQSCYYSRRVQSRPDPCDEMMWTDDWEDPWEGRESESWHGEGEGDDRPPESTEPPPEDEDRENGRAKNDERTCQTDQGWRSCEIDRDGNETCSGELLSCTYRMPHWEEVSCEPLTDEEIAQRYRRQCYTYDDVRYWQRYSIHAIDLADPDQPRLLPAIETDRREEMRGARVFGDRLHITHTVPVVVDGDQRDFVRWFFREVDVRADGPDALGVAVNVPGDLIERDGDALFTRDQLYGRHIVETTLNRLRLDGTRAVLEGTERFTDAWVRTMTLDGAGLFLVNHQPWYRRWGGWHDDMDNADRDLDETASRLSVYRIAAEGFNAVANVPVDDWAHLRQATPGRALFSVGGGLLIISLEDPTSPTPQAYFALRGWPSRFVPVGERLWIPSGRYGIQDVDTRLGNLLD